MRDAGEGGRAGGRRRSLMWIFLGWTMAWVFFTAKPYLSALYAGKPFPDPRGLITSGFDIYLWAAMTPGIFWLSRRFPLDGASWRRSLPVHLAAGLGVAVFGVLVNFPVHRWVFPEDTEPLGVSLVPGLHFQFQWYATMVAFGHVLAYHRQARERELRASRLEAELARAQIQALKLQIQPHFLFNALTAISELVYEDARLADRALMRLADLLRRVVDHAGDTEVTLRHELAFLRAYVELQKIRFRDRLEVHVAADPQCLDALVPNLVLQPLVENSLRHAMAPGGGTLEVRVSASRAGSALTLEVRDNGPGVAPDARPGVGVANVRARLEQLYGPQARLELETAPEGGALARVTLPWIAAPAVAASPAERAEAGAPALAEVAR